DLRWGRWFSNRWASRISSRPVTSSTRVASSASADLTHLQPVAVGIPKHGHVSPRLLEDARLELDAPGLERLTRLGAVVRVDRVGARCVGRERLALAGFPRPQHELELLAREADGHEPRSFRVPVVQPPFEAEGLGVEIERPVLVA